MKNFSVTSLLMLAAIAALPPARAAAPSPLERLDPPSWWVGFEDPELRILVHGRQIADLVPSLRYPGVTLVKVARPGSPNYLELTLTIGRDAPPGAIPIRFERGGKLVAEHRYPLLARRPGSRERQGFAPGDVIYLIVPDRFANGDRGNDRAPGTLDDLARARPGARHGGDLAGIAQHLDYLADMGYTQLWLTPVLENAQPAYSYHGYSITDHYRVDPRFGTNEALRALSASARAHGLGLIGDIVVNHIGSGHWWMRDPPAGDWINGSATAPLTNHMHTTIQDPHAATIDRERFTRGWFAPTMPDLNTTNPALASYLIENALWWVEYADLSGIRMDTYSYSDKAFVAEFTRRLMAEYPRFNIVAEEWRNDPAMVAYWQAGKRNHDGYVSYLPSLMDFPLMSALLTALTSADSWNSGWTLLYERLADDFLYANPNHLVVFGDNHDTDRLYTALGRDDGLWRLALAFIATTRGIPELTYGTEVLLANGLPHDDGEARADFPGGWSDDPVDAFVGRNLDARAAAAQAYLRTLLRWRRTAPAVTAGELRHYAPEHGVYVYFRQAAGETVMVALNKSVEPVRLDLARFRDSLPRGATGRDVVSGEPVVLGDELVVAGRTARVIDIR